ncbi:aromatic ring-hydroxylating oxygenase subunit alpha [Oscillatoria salina]|uniref:aromatic ring-hydroxylating oxygenase subunit alpha n=1 Tax=Oscillatoria salina TaxID=331517 RepID=UPI0013B9BCE8|nr:aromatic ring-hydroxylating dioxygenase subunit alpha [Oscillatoria salina]MBZ8181884.1 aromatic ring-hydroxylating dioxygenase subunit alpha [Oscillatoria salina IIICB1]NET89206.1 aromatic ring-hydroxylating dioxygenase subunit alpha [Kamptonema sp. SIO1D9]
MIQTQQKTFSTPDFQSSFLDAKFYTDPNLLAREKQKIFRRSWLYVGDAANLSRAETVWVTEVAGYSILIIRDSNHTWQAFHNVCPHRASVLVPEIGIHSLKRLVCPYHAWVYNLNGQLKGIPAKNRFPSHFCDEDFPLKKVRCEQWLGFIFVCFSEDTPPLEEYLGEIIGSVKEHHTEATKLLVKKQYSVACNWKNYHDNTLCDYHVPIVHPHTLNPIQGSVCYYEHFFDRYVNLLYTPTTKEWRSRYPSLSHLSDRARFGFFTYGIFPNLHLLALPNGVLAWLRIDPVTVESCLVNLEIYGIPDFSPPAAELASDFEAFMSEDMKITEGVQKGYASGVYQAGLANELEARILHQQQLIRSCLQADN